MKSSPTFTRKHYVAIAATVAAIGNKTERARQCADYCATFDKDNARLDAVRFGEACGL